MWETASDLWITSATKMRLLTDSRTPALDINVETQAGGVTLFGMVPAQEAKNGVVRLTGTVPTGAQRLEAAVLARSIEGEHAVKDDLRLETCQSLNSLTGESYSPVPPAANRTSRSEVKPRCRSDR